MPDMSDPLPQAEPEVPIAQSEQGPEDAALVQDITQQALSGIQRHIDAMLEFRLRQTLAPLLEKAAATLVADMREELGHTLKDVVARAVAQEVSRHRSR